MSRNVFLLDICGAPARCHCVVSTTVTLSLTKLTNYLEQSHSLVPNTCWVKKLFTFHPTRVFITTFTRTRHLSLPWARSIQATTYYYVFRSILISFHRLLGLPSGLIDYLVFQVVCFFQVSSTKTLVGTSSRPIRATSPTYPYSSWFHHPNHPLLKIISLSDKEMMRWVCVRI